jgi:hypothetical protein
MLLSDPILPRFAPVDLRNPVDGSHWLNRGRIAWWLSLPNQYGGRLVYDILGNHHGTLGTDSTGNPSWRSSTRPGGFSGALMLPGSGAKVTGTVTIPASGFTIAGWYYTASTLAQAVFALGSTGANDQAIHMRTNGATAALFGMFNDDLNVTVPSTIGWHRFTVTLATSLTQSLFWDGKLAGSRTSTSGYVGNSNFFFGRNGWDPSNYLVGQIDDVAVWNRQLSATEIKADYDLSRMGYPGVIRRLPVFGGSGISPFFFNRFIRGAA